MARRDSKLTRLNNEVQLCMTERCRLRGQFESREITSQEWESGNESNDKRLQQAVARRNVRMQELGLSFAPSTDSLIA